MKISRTYSRKLNRAKYGGNQYEMTDISCTYEEELLPNQEVHAASELFHEMAKADVEQSIIKEIESIKSNTAPF